MDVEDDDPKVIRAQALFDKRYDLTAAEYLEVRSMLDMRVTITPKEAWEMIGCSHDKFWKLVKAKIIRTYKDGPKRVRVLVVDVWNYMIEQASKAE